VDLVLGIWAESVLGEIVPDSNVTKFRPLAQPAVPQRFFRIRAALPFTP
jgi:hypothetical protein